MRNEDQVAVGIASEEVERARPDHGLLAIVTTDEGVFEATGKEIDGVTVSLTGS